MNLITSEGLAMIDTDNVIQMRREVVAGYVAENADYIAEARGAYQ